jgi:hypothetical protein
MATQADHALDETSDIAVSRVRLPAEIVRRLRYILCEWAGDAGIGSNIAAQLEQLERLSQRPELAPGDGSAWRRAVYDDAQEMHVRPAVAAPSPDAMWPQERWCAKAPKERAAIRRAYVAFQAMECRSPFSAVVLNALYGDMPPGLPERGMWPNGPDEEYRRVCRYAPSCHGSPLRMEAILMVDRKARNGEPPEDRRARMAAALNERNAILSAVARECEFTIVRASQAYIAAWMAA